MSRQFVFVAVTLLLTWNISSDAVEPARYVAVCSTTQIADFTRQIVGDTWQVRCVLNPGQDPHLYQTKPSDLKSVEEADLCIENGWHLEGGDWMRNLANTAGKPIITCVEKIQPLVLNEGDVEVNDPHAWFTPANAVRYVRSIHAGVSKVAPEHADEYKLRAELYLRQLQTLDAWIQKQVNSIPSHQRVLVTSHDAFGYFCQQYEFRSAAPAGWSTGAEVGGDITPARRQNAVDSIRKFGVRSIFVETSVNQKLIRQIAAEAGVSIGGELYSDSMGRSGTAGESYIGMMRENVVKIVLGLK